MAPGISILKRRSCAELFRRAGIVRARTLSTSCDQAIFADQATDASVSSDAALGEIDWLG
jgi:hypothetical protein